MVPCRSCHIGGTWRSKEVGGERVLKLSWGGGLWGELTRLDTMLTNLY